MKITIDTAVDTLTANDMNLLKAIITSMTDSSITLDEAVGPSAIPETAEDKPADEPAKKPRKKRTSKKAKAAETNNSEPVPDDLDRLQLATRFNAKYQQLVADGHERSAVLDELRQMLQDNFGAVTIDEIMESDYPQAWQAVAAFEFAGVTN